MKAACMSVETKRRVDHHPRAAAWAGAQAVRSRVQSALVVLDLFELSIDDIISPRI
jgi:hypothetical protein